MKLRIEFGRETDGRWIAEVTQIPGVLAYGKTRAAALAAVEALALRVIADRIENGEIKPAPASVLFEAA
jgi:predicted RNase H-like HicB family nuclease